MAKSRITYLTDKYDTRANAAMWVVTLRRTALGARYYAAVNLVDQDGNVYAEGFTPNFKRYQSALASAETLRLNIQSGYGLPWLPVKIDDKQAPHFHT